MNDPNAPSDKENKAASETGRSDTQSHANDAPRQSAQRPLRFWLLFCLLAVVVVLLTVRDDLRRDAKQASEEAVRYLAFDVMGWSPRDVFIWRLRLAGLLDSPLGQRWIRAVERASVNAVKIGAQYRTVESFVSDKVEAHVYQLTLERGEKLIWQFSRQDPADNQLYASLERRERSEQEWSTIEALQADEATESRIISHAGDYRFVLQPELFASATYSLALANGGSLPFPVKSASQRDIGSVFGDPRDGGARQHHGVDIFADKRTPVTAVIDGQVRTGTGGIGGKHIWLSGGLVGLGSARYYYAHLDDFAVTSGDDVQQGDVIGYVGNTGNARTTPPHLHFGIYSGGPVDPAPYLRPQPELPSH